MPPHKDKWIRRFVINDTTRHKNGFTIYKVSSVIFLKSSPDSASRVSVWKRYNDFKKLHSALKNLHSTLRIKETFPEFAKPKFFGRFEAEVIDERRQCAIKFLEFVARHASLFTSDAFVKFFETSLGDEGQGDCSQSLSSDTSEDDKSAVMRVTESNVGTEDAIANDRPTIDDNGASMDADKTRTVDDCGRQKFWSIEELAEVGRDEDARTRESPETSIDATDFGVRVQDSGQYILIAAAHMSAGLRHESMAEYEEAFMQYKLGIATMRQGAQNDSDAIRRTAVVQKIMKYSERADRLYDRHLNCNISTISKPVAELQYYKVLRVVGSVMLVKDVRQGCTKVIKTVEKPAGVQEESNKYILRGRVPHMVRLHACVQTETTVFLILEYASGGKLWDLMKKCYPTEIRKRSSRQKSRPRSSSCEPMIHRNSQNQKITNSKKLNYEIANRENIENSSSQKIQDFANTEKSRITDERSSIANVDDSNDEKTQKKNKILPTTQLLTKSQKLLKSVNETLKNSNKIANRLNSLKIVERTKSIEIVEKNLNYCDSTQMESSNDSSSDHDCENDVDEGEKNIFTIEQLPIVDTNESCEKKNLEKLENLNFSILRVNDDDNDDYDRNHHNHDEDSGVEMEREFWSVPETISKNWTAQILLALEALHQQNVVVADLRPENILVNDDNHVLLTYFVPRKFHELTNYKKPYAAPELSMYSALTPPTSAADIWSFGIIVYEIFTGIPFQSRHPGPFHSHSIISIPNELSNSAKSLLTKVLRFEPSERLTISEIKQLPFFDNVDWLGLLNA